MGGQLYVVVRGLGLNVVIERLVGIPRWHQMAMFYCNEPHLLVKHSELLIDPSRSLLSQPMITTPPLPLATTITIDRPIIF